MNGEDSSSGPVAAKSSDIREIWLYAGKDFLHILRPLIIFYLSSSSENNRKNSLQEKEIKKFIDSVL
jgi:hypothetical protein